MAKFSSSTMVWTRIKPATASQGTNSTSAYLTSWTITTSPSSSSIPWSMAIPKPTSTPSNTGTNITKTCSWKSRQNTSTGLTVQAQRLGKCCCASWASRRPSSGTLLITRKCFSPLVRQVSIHWTPTGFMFGPGVAS